MALGKSVLALPVVAPFQQAALSYIFKEPNWTTGTETRSWGARGKTLLQVMQKSRKHLLPPVLLSLFNTLPATI